jgi:lipoprotein-anchoring transpeptidase ErfK/SrfK
VVGHDGKAVPVKGKFTTINPDKQVNGQFQLADGQVVGVAAPIIIQFDASISDKAAVEKALKVTTEPPVEGSWAWLPDEVGGARVHYRTREYYPPGTKVNVDAKLYGVTVRRRRLRRAGHLAELRDRPPPGGQGRGVVAPHPGARRQGVIMDFPCSYGEADLPRNITRSGVHVVTEKYEDFYMSNPAAGYSNATSGSRCGSPTTASSSTPTRPAPGAQGNTNVTNGCINLSTVTPSSTSTARSTATRSRSPAPPSSCPTPTATSGTGPCHAVGRASARQRATWRLGLPPRLRRDRKI